MTAPPTICLKELAMNRIVKTVAAVTMTLGLAVLGLPLGVDGGSFAPLTGSTGCCRQ